MVWSAMFVHKSFVGEPKRALRAVRHDGGNVLASGEVR